MFYYTVYNIHYLYLLPKPRRIQNRDRQADMIQNIIKGVVESRFSGIPSMKIQLFKFSLRKLTVKSR